MPLTFIVRVFEREAYLFEEGSVVGQLVETLEFKSREQLAIFFSNGASFDPKRYYQVTCA